jgi:hypothetical protein
MCPQLPIAALSFDRLAGLPLLLGYAPQMAITMLIEPLIRDKACLGDLSMLSHRDHG